MTRPTHCVFAVACCVYLSAAPGSVRADPLDNLAGGDNPQLSEEAQRSLALLANNRPGGGRPAIPPVIGQDGSVQYLFGSQDPELVCAPLRLCDIVLQPGEEMLASNCGDVEHWKIDPTYGGEEPLQTPHVFVSPRDFGLQTDLAITTNRRTYHIRLIAHAEKFMPRISFVYPDDLAAKLVVLQLQRQRQKEKRDAARDAETMPDTGEYLGDLSFAYHFDGRAPWKPVRCWNDGRKTYIQLPPATEHTEAPTLLELRSHGDLFNDDELVELNHRVVSTPEGPRYVVDSVFDEAVLIAGVGRNQLRVDIRRLR